MRTSGEFPGGPVVRTQHFHYRGLGSIPGRGIKLRGAAKERKKERKEMRTMSRKEANLALSG